MKLSKLEGKIGLLELQIAILEIRKLSTNQKKLIRSVIENAYINGKVEGMREIMVIRK